MVFVEIETELTTAATDLLNFFVCIILAVVISRSSKGRKDTRSLYWIIIFLLLGLAGYLGSIAHGIEMPDELNRIVWMPLNLSLGLVVSFFIAVVIYELWGKERSRKYLPYLIGTGIVFFLVTVIFPGIFLIFIVYNALVMIFAFAAFVHLARRTGMLHYKIMVGVITTIILLSIGFSIVKLTGPPIFTLIWEFDQNSIFHIVQTFAMIVLALGIRSQFKSDADM